MKHRSPGAGGITPGEIPGGQRRVGGLAGAARPRKGNTGAQRSAQAGQNSAVECKGKSRPDRTLDSKGSGRETAA